MLRRSQIAEMQVAHLTQIGPFSLGLPQTGLQMVPKINSQTSSNPEVAVVFPTRGIPCGSSTQT
jgi:hypothetical protein